MTIPLSHFGVGVFSVTGMTGLGDSDALVG
jgi:hypothetical protein